MLVSGCMSKYFTNWVSWGEFIQFFELIKMGLCCYLHASLEKASGLQWLYQLQRLL
jgi:cell division protein FtsW (lipid II flippase)